MQDEAPKPNKVEKLGTTTKSIKELTNLAFDLESNEFKQYKAIGKNCCHFANELSLFLCDRSIPQYLLEQEIPILMTAAKAAGATAGTVFEVGVVATTFLMAAKVSK